MLYHWCPRALWEESGHTYAPPSLSLEGFIHFSYRHQVERTASSINRAETGLVLLCVDETAVDVINEDCYEMGEEFPHVYGSVPTSSVVAVMDFPPDSDGSFSIPPGTP